jgi:hypothetical protein
MQTDIPGEALRKTLAVRQYAHMAIRRRPTNGKGILDRDDPLR